MNNTVEPFRQMAEAVEQMLNELNAEAAPTAETRRKASETAMSLRAAGEAWCRLASAIEAKEAALVLRDAVRANRMMN